MLELVDEEEGEEDEERRVDEEEEVEEEEISKNSLCYECICKGWRRYPWNKIEIDIRDMEECYRRSVQRLSEQIKMRILGRLRHDHVNVLSIRDKTDRRQDEILVLQEFLHY